MTEKSVTQKTSTGEVDKTSLSKDEIDELSDMISDCMGTEKLDDTGSFSAGKDDDTGEFKPVDSE